MEESVEPAVLSRYRKRTRRKLAFIVGLGAALVVVAGYALVSGPISVPLSELPSILLGRSSGVHATVIWNIRLPRIVAAVGAGLGLAIAGAVLQSVLRNPLASPYTLGISQAASFGAAFAIIVLGTGAVRDSGTTVLLHNPYTTTVCAFLASLGSTGFVLAVAKYKRASAETLLLTGIALASLFTAGTTAMQYFATNVQLATLVFWKFGDVGSATWKSNAFLWLCVVIATLYFVRNAWEYNLLDAGDETARSLGVNVERTRLSGMVVASFLTAVVVSLFGIIGFVGLVVPHIARRLVGGDERFLIPASCLGGGALLLASDTAARTLLSPIILPVGIITSFIGVPLFVYLIVNGRDHW